MYKVCQSRACSLKVFSPLYSTVAVSFNYLWQWASWILIILSLVFPGAPRHSFQQHDALTRSSPLHPKLIGFFLSSPDIFCESKVIISWAEDVGRQRDSHASDSGDVIWLFCREWSFSHCVQSHGGDSYDWPGQLIETASEFVDWKLHYSACVDSNICVWLDSNI